MLEDQDRKYRVWVASPINRDSYDIFVSRYKIEGSEISQDFLNRDNIWQSYPQGGRTEPWISIPGYLVFEVKELTTLLQNILDVSRKTDREALDNITIAFMNGLGFHPYDGFQNQDAFLRDKEV